MTYRNEPLTAESFNEAVQSIMDSYGGTWNTESMKKRKTYHEVSTKRKRRKNGVRKP